MSNVYYDDIYRIICMHTSCIFLWVYVIAIWNVRNYENTDPITFDLGSKKLHIYTYKIQ